MTGYSCCRCGKEAVRVVFGGVCNTWYCNEHSPFVFNYDEMKGSSMSKSYTEAYNKALEEARTAVNKELAEFKLKGHTDQFDYADINAVLDKLKK